jgi:hypothetical protein
VADFSSAAAFGRRGLPVGCGRRSEMRLCGVANEILVTSPWRDLCFWSRRLPDAVVGQHPVELVARGDAEL